MLRAGCVPLKIDPPPFPPNLVRILFRKSFPDHSTGKKDRKKRKKTEPNINQSPDLSVFNCSPSRPEKARYLGRRAGGASGWCAHRKTGQYVINWKTSRAGNLWQQHSSSEAREAWLISIPGRHRQSILLGVSRKLVGNCFEKCWDLTFRIYC